MSAASAPDAAPTLLRAEAVSKRFSGIVALSDVSLSVEPGELVAVIGPNGAGKSTLFNCLSGVLRPDRGSVTFAGRSIDGLRPSQRARLGIARTFQRIELFGGMTVRDHLLVADQARLRRGGRWSDLFRSGRPEPDQIERSDRVLELVGLAELADRPAESLSLGKGRLVELGRALMCEPRLLFLDEPSSGLDQVETDEMSDALETVRDHHGTAVVLIEHDVPMVQRLASRTYVLDHGLLIGSGPTDEVMADERVRVAYLGDVAPTVPTGQLGTAPPARPAARAAASPDARPDALPETPSGTAAGDDGADGSRSTEATAPVLRLVGVDAAYGPFRALFDVTLEVPAGAAVALVGPNGSGKSTVARVASGLLAPDRGSVLVDGRDLSGRPPHVFARAGIAHAPEGRAVFASLTVEENLQLAFGEARVDGGVRGAVAEAFDLFPKLGERRDQVAGTLSGGEQRMLTLARVLVLRPRLLIADELSLGLAPIVTRQVYEVLARVRDAGCSLLVVEQHLDHALALADHVVVLRHGEVSFTGRPDEVGDLSAEVLLPAGAPGRVDDALERLGAEGRTGTEEEPT